MGDATLRWLAISTLRHNSDFSGLRALHECGPGKLHKLLRWLDQSGLALYLVDRLLQRDALDLLPAAFREALEGRLDRNRGRTVAMLEEFQRLATSLADRGVQFCALKGFTLTPDFCPAKHLRHQTDFDFLVAPESLARAKHALQAHGYNQSEVRPDGGVSFATPLRHIPSASDDIYARQRHHEVDLHVSLHRNEHGVSILSRSDELSRLQYKVLDGVAFPALATDDMFSVQVHHAFNHLLGSWVRISWLLEIGHFLDVHYNDDDLWRSVIARTQRDPVAGNAFGLILCLTQTLFPRPIPCALDEWCLRSLPSRIKLWVSEFGIRTAISDLDGAKLTLFVHREFITDSHSWNAYLLKRIFPLHKQSSVGMVPMVAPGARIKARLSQWLHSMRRAVFHVREFVSLPVDAIRWKRALRSIDRPGVRAAESDGKSPAPPPAKSSRKWRNFESEGG
jgi:hypothetical protein